MVWSLWHVLIPVLTRIGRFPARLLGMGADLPAGVARQWAFWGRHPQYVVDDEGRPRSELEAFAPPILALAPVDDARFAPEPALAGLLRRYAGAPHRVVRLPAPLGHFGFFRPGMEDWWKSLAQWTAAAGAGAGQRAGGRSRRRNPAQARALLARFDPPAIALPDGSEAKGQEAPSS
jgi:predicted alpha/beta hydrolase